MASWFASGRVVDGIVILILFEAAGLLFAAKKLRRHLSVGELAANLGAGVALLMSLRAALIGTAWSGIAPWLLVALTAHVADLKLRWDRTTRA